MLFLCGYAAYLTRHYADKYCGKDALTIFIHLPPPEKMDFKKTLTGVCLVIEFLVESRMKNNT